MATFDSNVWYQITNNAYSTSASLRVGDSKEAVYMYATNTSSQQQQWQIFPASGSGWNLRSAITGPAAYMSECVDGTTAPSTSDPTLANVCMALGNSGDLQREWILTPSSDGTFNIQLNDSNPVFTGYYVFVNNSNNYVSFTNNSNTPTGLSFTFASIAQINDVAFSSGVPGVSSQTSSSSSSSIASTTKSQSTTSTGISSSATSAQTSVPSASESTAPSKGGLSSGASAAIGASIGGIALIFAIVAAFWFSKRRKNTRAARLGRQPNGADGKSTPFPEWPQKSEMPANDTRVSRSLVELPGPVPELSSGTSRH